MKTAFFNLLLLGSLAGGAGPGPRDAPPASPTAPASDSLRAGFRNPPRAARPKVYWWWLNGAVDTTRLREELRAIKAAGLGGVDLFEIGVNATNNGDGRIPAGPPFLGPESVRAIVGAIREATRLDLEVGLNLASSWNAGGSWTRPEHAAKSLYVSKQRIGAAALAAPVTLAFPELPRVDGRGRPLFIERRADGRPVYHEEVAVLALPAGTSAPLDTAQVLDVSRFFDPKTERLTWTPPTGDWEIQRYVCANSGEALKLPSPNSRGPIIDHFDSSATRAHFRYFIDRLKPHLGDFRKTALKNLYLASYEATGVVWTGSLLREFQKLHGYSLVKFLPALFGNTPMPAALRARADGDLTRTLSELLINNHYRKGREIANAEGLLLISEAGGPGKPLHNVPVEALKALGSLDVPRGEFWNRYQYLDTDGTDIMWLVKEIAAAAHLYGRKVVEEEAFTSFEHWREGPADLKPLADRAFCEGMNRVVIHGFPHNPAGTGFPGIGYHAGTHFNDKRVWWPKIRPFVEYLARISHVLQQADFVADVLYFYGDQVPNFVAPKNSRFRVGPGYDYEVINADVLLRELTVRDGQLALPNGARFRVLALDSASRVGPAVAAKLGQLARQGAVITGWPAPPTGLAQGGSPVLARLRALGVGPDFTAGDGSGREFDYTHHRRGNLDVYLVRNTTDRWISQEFTFRQAGKRPERWDPLTGQMVPITVFQPGKTGTRLPLTFPPQGTYFIVFGPGLPTPTFTAIAPGTAGQLPRFDYTPQGLRSLDGEPLALTGNRGAVAKTPGVVETPLTGSWLLRFPPNWGAPDSARMATLRSWSESEVPGIRYFSGIATYHHAFSAAYPERPGERTYLDLGDLREVAEVWLNDQSLGITWAKPHRFDVTGRLRAGTNTLRVEVANTWSNRLTGDAIRGETYTSTPIRQGVKGLTWDRLPLLPSGLLGPVVLQRTRVFP